MKPTFATKKRGKPSSVLTGLPRISEIEAEVTGKKAKRDSLALLCLGTLGLGAINTLLFLLLVGAYTKLAGQSPTIVQTVNGETFLGTPFNDSVRSPAVIQRFATDALTQLMSWRAKIPTGKLDGSGRPIHLQDLGREVKGDKVNGKITTTAWQASFAFTESFRPSLVKILAQMTPPDIFAGNTESVLVPTAITVPVEVSDGVWKVKLVSNLIFIQEGSGSTRTVPFNKELIIRRTDKIPPLEEASSPIGRAIFSVRQRGLEIVSMKDLEN